jgi:hypothetical protein
LVGVAVNVTLVPAQIILSESLEAIVTLAGCNGFTVVVILFDVTGLPIKQGNAFEVITTLTASVLDKFVVV